MSTAAVQPTESPQRTAKDRLARGLFWCAVLSGLGLCLPLFRGGPLALDEHGSYWIIDPQIPASVWDRCRDYVATPPLWSWLQEGSVAVFGRSVEALRVPVLITYLLAIVVVGCVGRDLGGPLCGALSALVFAWHPQVLDEARIGRAYGLVLLLAALLVWWTVRWKRDPQRPAWPVVWSVTAGALFWTHYLALPFAGMCGVALLLPLSAGPQSTRPPLVRVTAAAGLTALLCLPLATPFLRLWSWSPFLNGRSGAVTWSAMIDPLWWAGLPIALAVAWLLNRFRLRPNAPAPRTDGAALLAWLALGLVMGAGLAGEAGLSSLTNPRYRVSVAVPAALLFVQCILRLGGRVPSVAGVLVGLVAVWSVTDHRPWRATRLDNPMDFAWRDMARIIGEHPSSTGPIFVQSGLVEADLLPAYFADELFSSYVACSLSHFYLPSQQPRYALPYQWRLPPEMSQWYRERLGSDATGAWLAAAVDTDLNQASVAGFERLARQAGYAPARRWEFAGAILVQYVPQPP